MPIMIFSPVYFFVDTLYICIGDYFFQKAIGVFESPLLRIGQFECSVQILRGPCIMDQQHKTDNFGSTYVHRSRKAILC
jgi:hypothetical protein